MPGHRGTETQFELTTIERLEALGYTHLLGMDIERPLDDVVLKDILRANLAARYRDLPSTAIDAAVVRFARPEGVDTIRRNMAFHELLTRGLELKVEFPDGRVEHRHIHAVDWENPQANSYHAVNQFPVHGKNDRRPDIVIFVNGLPLAVFELKNPYAIKPSALEAWNQIQHYVADIPQLFDFNAIAVVSDGVNTLHGMWDAPWEWFAPWKSIDGVNVEPATVGSMKTLLEGLFAKDRLLAYLRSFILFEVANDRIAKKGAKYHQFFAVRLAAQKAIEACRPDSDRRIGVIWHTTGSGKSLSMVFLIGILRRHPGMENPTFLVQVDRNDLDDQLHDQFVAAKALVGDVKHAESVDELRGLLQTEGGEIIFTTIEKFRLKDEGEVEHPVLSERSNIIVVADEAHRSQYGFVKGYARYLAEALPNARRLGFTGTPVSLAGADTVEVFGEVIHTYDIEQSQKDGATVRIFYEPRQVRLHLGQREIDAALKDIVEDAQAEQVERRKSRWAALAAAAGAKERIAELAQDLLAHFLERTRTLAGKALVVCMTRENCVRLYEALTALPDCPEARIVMTGNLGEDPKEWSDKGYLTTKGARDKIKKRMVDPDDALKIVIVCDMWLTGTDIPCLHTLYVDKPMQGHNLIQAISRVNRVFRDKPHGLIVDYIGIGEALREATAKYTQDGGRGKPAPGVSEEAKPLFLAALQAVRKLLPEGRDYGGWRRMRNVAMEDLYALVWGHLTASDDARDEFIQAEARASAAFLLVRHLDECRGYADEMIFYQLARRQLKKTIPGKPDKVIEQAVRDLVDDSIESAGVVDIFKAAGLDKPDISILDDDFLQTFKERPLENLRLKLLEKLMRDAIQGREKRNLAKYRSFREMLEATLTRYHNRTIDAAKVIQVLVEIRKQMKDEDKRSGDLGLEPEEVAFYDAVAENLGTIYGQKFLCNLIHEIVQSLKRTLKPDWTAPHREDVKADVRATVRMVLRRRGVKAEHLESFVNRVMVQAEALYADWPLAA